MLYNADVDIVQQSLDHINNFSGIQCKQIERKRTIKPVSMNIKNNVENEIKQHKKEEITAPKKATKKESPALSFFGKKTGKHHECC